MIQDSTQRIVIAANGAYGPAGPLRPYLDRADTIIACDGGGTWLHAHGYQPQILIGDLDSINADALAAFEATDCLIERYPIAKDETDGELALLKAASLGAQEIVLIGALGGRIDHELANIMLLAMPQLKDIAVTIFDGVSFLSLVNDRVTLAGRPGDTVSLIPMGGLAQGVTTVGLEYPLCDETLHVGPARGISNVLLTSSAQVTIAAGRLLVIHTPQEHLDDCRD